MSTKSLSGGEGSGDQHRRVDTSQEEGSISIISSKPPLISTTPRWAMPVILGIQAIDSKECQMLIGIGTDGASANIAAAGLKGLIEKEVPWLYWSWCLAHRVELAVKDALKGTSFDLIDDMLLRLTKNLRKSAANWRRSSMTLSILSNSMMLGLNQLELVAHAGYHTNYRP